MKMGLMIRPLDSPLTRTPSVHVWTMFLFWIGGCIDRYVWALVKTFFNNRAKATLQKSSTAFTNTRDNADTGTVVAIITDLVSQLMISSIS